MPPTTQTQPNVTYTARVQAWYTHRGLSNGALLGVAEQFHNQCALAECRSRWRSA